MYRASTATMIIFKDKKEKHYELGARVRLNTMTRINDRSTLYGQLETYMGMNGRDPYDINKYTYDKNGKKSPPPPRPRRTQRW